MDISFFLSYCMHFAPQSKGVLFCGLVPENAILIPRFSYKFLLWIRRCALNIEGYHLGIGKTYFLSTFLREERKMHTSFISQFNSTIRLSSFFFHRRPLLPCSYWIDDFPWVVRKNPPLPACLIVCSKKLPSFD